MADFLYRYELSNGRVYIGRDINANNMYKRANDHLFNALAEAFQIWQPTYHKGESNTKIDQLVHTSPQFMETSWGSLLRKKWAKTQASRPRKETLENGWIKLVTAINPDFTKQQFKDLLANNMMWAEEIDSIDNRKRKEDYNNRLDIENQFLPADKQKKKQTIYYSGWEDFSELTKQKKDLTNYELGNIVLTTRDQSKDLSSLYKLFEIENNVKSNFTNMFHLTSWNAKSFRVYDDFWRFVYNNQTQKKINIITLIEKSVTQNAKNLQKAKLGEFLLIGLSLSSPEGLINSLNKDIGDYKSGFNYMVETYGLENVLNAANNKEWKNAAQDKLNELPTAGQIKQDIIHQMLININTKLNSQAAVSKQESDDKMAIDVSIGKETFSLNDIMLQWAKIHNNPKDYWKDVGNQTNAMLQQCFKYCFLLNTALTSDKIKTNGIKYLVDFKNKEKRQK